MISLIFLKKMLIRVAVSVFFLKSRFICSLLHAALKQLTLNTPALQTRETPFNSLSSIALHHPLQMASRLRTFWLSLRHSSINFKFFHGSWCYWETSTCIHVVIPDKWDAKQYLSILSGTGFCQHITGSTHKHGHTLDLLISRIDDDKVQEWHTHHVLYTDHHIIKCILRLEKPAPLKVTKTSCKYGKIDLDLFQNLLDERLGATVQTEDDPNLLSETY